MENYLQLLHPFYCCPSHITIQIYSATDGHSSTNTENNDNNDADNVDDNDDYDDDDDDDD